MDQRRTYLRDLATKLADAWAASATPTAFAGDVRADTRNTSYVFSDGVCSSVTRRDRDRAWRVDNADRGQLVGMRLVGWLLHDDPYAGLQQQWCPGAYAVMWRARGVGDTHSQVALTSATTAMTLTPRARARMATAARVSTPPPLPSRALGVQRPAPPVSMVMPKVPSLTRMHVPPPPLTPTPTTQIRQTHRMIPPPLPQRAARISP
jgi:hypothetical protein